MANHCFQWQQKASIVSPRTFLDSLSRRDGVMGYFLRSIIIICFAFSVVIAGATQAAYGYAIIDSTGDPATANPATTACCFGTSASPAFGEVFNPINDAGDITSFSLYLIGGTANGPLLLRGYLAVFNYSTGGFGPVLYESDVRTYSGDGSLQEFQFSTDVSVDPSAQYIAFLSILDAGDQPNNVYAGMPVNGSTTVPGNLETGDLHANEEQLADGAWIRQSDKAWIKVIFGGDALPEPSTWALMLSGFGMVGAVMRRQRRLSARMG